jgi:hypothetical protein
MDVRISTYSMYGCSFYGTVRRHSRLVYAAADAVQSSAVQAGRGRSGLAWKIRLGVEELYLVKRRSWPCCGCVDPPHTRAQVLCGVWAVRSGPQPTRHDLLSTYRTFEWMDMADGSNARLTTVPTIASGNRLVCGGRKLGRAHKPCCEGLLRLLGRPKRNDRLLALALQSNTSSVGLSHACVVVRLYVLVHTRTDRMAARSKRTI